MRAKGVIAGYVLGVVTVVGCANFPYHYFSTKMPADCYDKGTLLGKADLGGWPDESLSECKPDAEPAPGTSPSPGPAPILLKCMTMKAPEFYSLKADDEKCHSDLDICQAGKPPQ